MARILGAGIAGELRGKLGAFVFARNASGAYVRSYALPVNPNTSLQAVARGNFSQVVAQFHDLESSEKSQWDESAIASETFSSGFNAFVSANMSLASNAQLESGTFTLDGDETPTYGNFTLIRRPPASDIVVPTILQYDSGMFDTSGSIVTAEMQFNIIAGIGTAETGFVDDFTPAAISIYMSNANSQPAMFFRDDVVKLGITTPLTDILEGAIPTASTSLSVVCARNLSASKFNPSVGDYLRFSAYWEDVYGRKILITRAEEQLSST